MATLIVNESLCFVYSHFGNVPNENIALVLAKFYSDDDLVKAKAAIHEVCMRSLDESSVPRIIAHKKTENKRKLDAEDIVKFVVLLDENITVKNVTFVASDLRKVPQVDPSSVDLCFLMETVDDLRRKVESLLDVKQQLSAVQNMVSGLSAKVNVGLNARQNNQEQAHRPSTQPVGMAKDTNLKVNFPPAASSGSSSQPILASSNASRSGNGKGSSSSSQGSDGWIEGHTKCFVKSFSKTSRTSRSCWKSRPGNHT
jgi:hypothetical protein